MLDALLYDAPAAVVAVNNDALSGEHTRRLMSGARAGDVKVVVTVEAFA